jgi:2-oxoglutarate dehydrogenase E2 component (dihydrolipoamide succinyltransferase)
VRDLSVPIYNATDDSYLLVEWLAPDGAEVGAGDPVALVETSKAVADLVAGEAGFLVRLVAEGGTCRPGQVVARLFDSHDMARVYQDSGAGAVAADTGPAVMVTRPAQALLDEYGLGAEAVAALGQRIVRREDVDRLVARRRPVAREVPTDPRPAVLSDHQAAVARAVSRSHATIPAAFTLMKVAAVDLLRRRAEAVRQTGGFVGLPELVVEAVAEVAPQHPRILARVADDLSLDLAGDLGIGVTVDVGTGLYIGVVHGADLGRLADIARRLMYLRTAALRDRLTAADLAGARITIALHQERGVVYTQPIVHPGQVCALALGAVQSELRRGPSGDIELGEYVHLGLAYDHRVVNGREAMMFLGALRDRLEGPSVTTG